MESMYFDLVIAGKRTCDAGNSEVVKVPIKYREAVLGMLLEKGYDGNGKVIVRA